MKRIFAYPVLLVAAVMSLSYSACSDPELQAKLDAQQAQIGSLEKTLSEITAVVGKVAPLPVVVAMAESDGATRMQDRQPVMEQRSSDTTIVNCILCPCPTVGDSTDNRALPSVELSTYTEDKRRCCCVWALSYSEEAVVRLYDAEGAEITASQQKAFLTVGQTRILRFDAESTLRMPFIIEYRGDDFQGKLYFGRFAGKASRNGIYVERGLKPPQSK